MKQRTRLGRPPDTDSAETRARIVTVARQLFAAKGYEATSNRVIAEEAGVTTGAIYHYFDRKIDIFTAVYVDTQAEVYERFDAAAENTTTFADRLRSILEVSYQINAADPAVAQFLGSYRVDAARDPELAQAVKDVQALIPRREFAREMLELGIRTGEIEPDQADAVAAVLDTITVGLTDAVSNDTTRHRRAIDGIISLIEGKLIHKVSTS